MTLVTACPEIGAYLVTVTCKGQLVAEIPFRVSNESENQQLHFDLAQAGKADGIPRADCDCVNYKKAAREVSSKGYLVFSASSRSGFGVTVSDKAGKVIYDPSKGFRKGDYFALSLLRPGAHTFASETNSVAGEINVTLPRNAEHVRKLETCYVNVPEGFKQKSVSLVAMQGLVFRFNAPAAPLQIKMKQVPKPEPDKKVVPVPLVQWRNLPFPKK